MAVGDGLPQAHLYGIVRFRVVPWKQAGPVAQGLLLGSVFCSTGSSIAQALLSDVGLRSSDLKIAWLGLVWFGTLILLGIP